MFRRLLLAASLALGASTSPVPEPAAHTATNVYLLSTPTQSAAPAGATGLNLFDPYYQPEYLLRAQPGGASYVQFNLTGGVLSARATGPHGVGGVQTYASHVAADTGAVFFLPREPGAPGLFTFCGRWLALNGSTDGFTDCAGAFGQRVIHWKGTDASCTKTFIFKQADAPAS